MPELLVQLFSITSPSNITSVSSSKTTLPFSNLMSPISTSASGKFNIKGFLEKLGVTSERVSKGKMATLFSVNKSFTKDEETKFNTMMSDMYNSFVNLVSKSRNLDYDKSESASKGRVWTSLNAMELGLIDKIGGLKDAINEAHKMSDLSLRDFPNVKVIATKQNIALGSLLKFNSLFNRKLDVIDLMQNFNKERFFNCDVCLD